MFLKAQASSLTASAVDFAVTTVLKEWLHVGYLSASVWGTISGGVVNFSVNRRWAFSARDAKMYFQAVKYGTVWLGNLGLVTLGVYLLTHYGGINYFASKVIASLFVGFFYNYTLHKKFVFK